ncbi:uncharacterized protein LOC111379230 [Olea europaea var. sylvestris]|uniref:uncharacterized protein LOC111379230 n=1 Tax=Olea europaea var. sylvestris TaxID=158386 RepID=UPI000C1D1C2A|nr:uncharacterized protein LOC111379230 [Olea europaea var. sylvestris]
MHHTSAANIAQEQRQKAHSVAVHGIGHGAWVCYKLKPRIEASGIRFMALILAAAGFNEKKVEEWWRIDRGHGEVPGEDCNGRVLIMPDSKNRRSYVLEQVTFKNTQRIKTKNYTAQSQNLTH